MTKEVFIVGAARTPVGSFQGALASLSAPKLGAVAIREAVSRAGLTNDDPGEVFVGNVLSAGIGQAPARQAARFAGLPDRVPATTVNKVCGSGLQSVVLATRALRLGDVECAVAGGIESMSNVPYYLPKARNGYRMGHGQVIDGMIHDGLWDPYGDFHMGNAGDKCARELGFTREQQDEFARESYRRALAAQKEGRFAKEIVGVEVPGAKGATTSVTEDEEPGRGNPDKMASLRPAFAKEGTVTAANASKINDGAAAVVLATGEHVKAKGLRPIARIVGYGVHAQAPEWFTTAPSGAIADALRRTGLETKDIDLFEINEAFAVVAMATMKESKIEHARVNVNGGAVAIGHPIGASGSRLLVTLLAALEAQQAKRGLVTLCIGGGEAIAVIVERV
ncbi:MAG: thiolase family protein [Deltaproteobacteria bacterium]|nr:thiolase family protein [Deltaproteobacteria bacterium]